MAVRTIRVDDIDQVTEDGVQTITFGWRGQEYAIDLSGPNVEQLGELLDPYMAVATPIAPDNGGRHTRGPVRRRSATPTDSSEITEIRDWAAQQGFDVGTRGRIKKSVREAFYAAKGA